MKEIFNVLGNLPLFVIKINARKIKINRFMKQRDFNFKKGSKYFWLSKLIRIKN